MRPSRLAFILFPLALLTSTRVVADAPVAAYVFPAGAQRGTAVKVRVGGLCLYDRCAWELGGPGVVASKLLTRTKTLWFEGPRLPLVDSQRQEDYPQDMLGDVVVAKDTALGVRRGRLWTSEGAAGGLAFMVGELPEVVEDERGEPGRAQVTLPVTINGRIFPREDVDVWTFDAKKGRGYTCEVFAARLGSPLDSRLEVRDPDGEVVAENDDARGTDSFLQFVAARDGKHSVRIHDSQRGGSQRHTYRLTITDGPAVERVFPLGGRKGTKTLFSLTGVNVPKDGVALTPDEVGVHSRAFEVDGKATNAVALDFDELPEVMEAEPNDTFDKATKCSIPCVLNGRIDRPGDADYFRFDAKKGQALELAMRGQLLGSPLSGVVEILDDAGKVIAKSAPRAAEVLFTVPKDGAYVVRLGEQFRTRGGPAFAYRLRLREAKPDFRLELTSNALTVRRGEKGTLRVGVGRSGGFNGPVAISLKGLPAGVKVAPATAGAGQAQIDLAFTADKDAAIAVGRVEVVGTATLGKAATTRGVDDVLLAVGLKAPFKIVGAYDLRLAARGTVFRKKFTIERNGYAGPLEVRLADKQARHLQGVSGPTLTVPADVNEFEYPVTLPPWMETGRTSRACVMAVGKVKIGDVEHVVSFSSQAQNEQLIAVVETGQLGLELARSSIAIKTGSAGELAVSIRRGKELAGAATIEVIADGFRAEPLTIPADKSAGVLKLSAGDKARSRSVLIRATVQTKAGPVMAETRADVVVE